MFRRKTLIPAVLLTVGFTVLSLMESPRLPEEIAMQDKLLHGFMYTLLAIAWTVSIQITNYKSQITKYLLVCLSVTAYGALMELLQHYCTVTRSGEWLDVLADFIGALIGVAIVAIINHRSPITNDQ